MSYCKENTSNSLISAVREGRLECERELIDSFGLSYSQAWSDGYVLLCDAIENTHTAVAKLLLTNGSKVNSENKTPSNTPLHFAVINGDKEIVEMLLDRGANTHVKNHFDKTPLHKAIENKSMEITELLLNQGANANDSMNNGIVPLHIAAHRGNLQIVEHLLKHGAYVNSVYTSTYREGYTPLCFAVEVGSEDIVKLLLSGGANVDAKGKRGVTLHIAAHRGNLQIVELLLKHGANVNSAYTSRCSEGYTPLCLAVQRGHENVVKLLLEYGANVDAQYKKGKTSLHFAVQNGHENVVQLLLEYGANVNAQDKYGMTILHFAVEKRHPVIIEHILKHCPDINNKSNRNALNAAVYGYGKVYTKIVANLLQYGFTVNPEDVNNYKLLLNAVEKGYMQIVEELLKYGTDVNISISGKGKKPLHVATKNKQEEVAKLLISYGAHVNAQDETGNTPIFYATENADLKMIKLLLTNKANVKDNPKLLKIAVKNKCREIVEVLLQHGADVNTSDTSGRTALHFTAEDDYQVFYGSHLDEDPDMNVKGEIAKLLLSRGANVNAQTKYGMTTLHAAVEQENVKVVEALLEYNADVNSTLKTGITPLHLSAQKGNGVIIKMLLNKGANINAKQKDRITALHIATKKGYKEVVEILLKFGADIDSTDEYGSTALHIASKEGHKQVVISLLEYGSDINIMKKYNYTPLKFDMTGIFSFYNQLDDYDSDYNYYDICTCEEIAEILKQHIVKMKTANLYVNEQNLVFISSNNELNDFQNECEEEIESMKSEKISNNVTFHDILTKDIRLYARNKNIVQVLQLDDYKTKFPIYASMINTRFRKGVERNELLEQGNTFFQSLFNSSPELPYNCTEQILSHLSDKDLKNFIDACKPANVSSPNTNIKNVAITANFLTEA